MALGTLLERLLVSIQADIDGFTSEMDRAVKEARKSSEGISRQFTKVGNGMAMMGAGLTAGVTAPIIALGVQAAKSAVEAKEALSQVEAALNSMGDGAGRSSEQIQKVAADIQRLTGVSDDAILQDVSANLLTFGSVAEEQFDRATRAAVDLSARLGQDLQSSTIMIGKALNDPILGLTALRRVGIQFTAEQERMIKSMTEMGDVAGAQKVMLGELERQFGGSAAALAEANPWRVIQAQIDDVVEEVGMVILEILPPILNFIQTLLDGWNALSPAGQELIMVLGGVAAVIGPLLVALGAVVSAIGTLIPVVAGISAAIGTAGLGAALGAALVAIGPVVAAVGALVAAFLLFKDKLIPVFRDFGRQVNEVLGPRFKQVFEDAKAYAAVLVEFFQAVWQSGIGDAIRFVVDKLGDLLAVVARVLGTALIRVLDAAGAALSGAFKFMSGILTVFTSLLKGDFSGAWEAAKGVVVTMITTMYDVVKAIFPGITDFARRLYTGVKEWLMDKLAAVFNFVVGRVGAVKDAFFKLYDDVVGNSYVPDMVEEIGFWMAKLDQNMVVPATNATDAVRDEFERLAFDVERIFDGLMTDSQRAARQMAQDLDTLDKALEAGVINQSEYDRAKYLITERTQLDDRKIRDEGPEITQPEWMRRWQDDLTRMREEEIRATEDAFNYVGNTLRDTLAEAIETGRVNWRSLLADMVHNWRDVLKVMAEAWKSMQGGFNAGGGGIGGMFKALASGISTVFGGARAIGGDVTAGKAYRVGENGPEWFVPGQNGAVVPGGKGSSGGTTVNVYANDAVLAETVKGWVKAAMDHGTRAAETAFESARAVAPMDQAQAAEGAFVR